MIRARSLTVVVESLDCATSSHSSPTVSRSSSGTAGEADSMPVATVSSEMAGFFRAIAFAESIAFRVKPPRRAYCS